MHRGTKNLVVKCEFMRVSGSLALVATNEVSVNRLTSGNALEQVRLVFQAFQVVLVWIV